MLRFIFGGLSIAGSVVRYACITHCVFEYLGDLVVCNGPSMEPTLYSKNVIVTDRISPRFQNIKRGDIIIARNPNNPLQNICKRVVGLPGDKIKITSDFSYNPYKIQYALKNKSSLIENEDKLEAKSKNNKNDFFVPRGYVWIEGDNSEDSTDSRIYGPIPQGLILSRAIFRLWPLTDIRLL